MSVEINTLLTPGEVVEKSWELKKVYIFATNKRLIIRDKTMTMVQRGPINVLHTQDVAYEHINSIEHEIVKPKIKYVIPFFIGAVFLLIIWVISQREFMALLLSFFCFAIAIFGLIYGVVGYEQIVLHTAAGPIYIKARGSEGFFREILYYVRLKKRDKEPNKA
jgi:hypothetical protein